MEINVVEAVVANLETLARQIGPSIATVGTVIAGLVVATQMWMKWSPAIIKRLFSKAS